MKYLVLVAILAVVYLLWRARQRPPASSSRNSLKSSLSNQSLSDRLLKETPGFGLVNARGRHGASGF